MTGPAIGITPSQQEHFPAYFLPGSYADAVAQAGGIPLLLPYQMELIPEYLASISGLLLSGGIDPDPLIWEEEPVPGMGRIDPLRDQFELELINGALELGMPILGICRGCQMLNIAGGGTLYQDIANTEGYLKHNQDAPRWYPTHTVAVKVNTRLYGIYQDDQLRVNSIHHQAIKDIPAGFVASAEARDGVIEAIERKEGSFALGVQWHPEAMLEREQGARTLFAEFVKAAWDYHEGRKD